ncbi:hypothetical protein H5410_052449, partial [Solanum commersonii]
GSLEIKKQYYTRDITKKVVHASNFDLYSPSVPAANWRDCILIKMAPNPPNPKEFPRPCRYGLPEGLGVLALYYPACPRPELTIGTNKHSDNDFLIVLLQDHIGGLQVLHQNQWEWFDVPHMRGALVVNIEDLLQANSMSYSKLYGPISELLSEITLQNIVQPQLKTIVSTS